MLDKRICPVPLNQRPLEEFKEFSDSWFFSWPFLKKTEFLMVLIYIWIISSVIFMFISSGSITLVKNKIELIAISITYSLSIPGLVIIRLLVGWSYIHKRLSNQIVTYEETDWHDGQKWKKPIESHHKDSFIAKYEVLPIVKLLKYILISLMLILLFGSTYLNYSFN